MAKISFSLTYGEASEASSLLWERMHQWRAFLSRWRYYFGGLGACVAGALWQVDPILAILAFGGVIGAIVMDGVGRIMDTATFRRDFKEQSEIKNETVVIITADGIEHQSRGRAVSVSWTELNELLKGRRVWVLPTGKYVGIIIPVRLLDEETKKFIEECVKMPAYLQSVSSSSVN